MRSVDRSLHDFAGDERRVAVVGAGLTGLAVAYLLGQERPGWTVSVLEAEPFPGGKARSTVRAGYTVDWGPNGFLAVAPETLELVRRLGLEGELQTASEAARRRYVYRDGGLRPLPTTPPAFLASELVPWPGRVRASLEAVLARRSDGEESVHAFLARHFGRSFADALADVLVTGITAGDPRELSLDALFPRFRALEGSHGSLVRALIAQQRAARRRRAASGGAGSGPPDAPAVARSRAGPPAEGAGPQPATGAGNAPRTPGGRLTSFRSGGMQRLAEALSSALPRPARLGASVRALQRSGTGGGYLVEIEGAAPLRVDTVILATPAPAAAALLRPLAPAAAEALAAIPYAGLRVFGLGFDRVDVPRTLDGFGFLVPRGEGVRSLGVLWTSALYPDRAPEGKTLLRVLAGGRLDPGMLDLSDDEALLAVRRDLRLTMGIAAQPEFVEAVRWDRAIPQYTLGHEARVRAAEEALGALPGVHLAGNAYRGVGVNDCVRDARRVVAAVASSA